MAKNQDGVALAAPPAAEVAGGLNWQLVQVAISGKNGRRYG